MDHSPRRVPRAVLLALWAPRVRRTADAATAEHAITGDDEPHLFDAPAGLAGGAREPSSAGVGMPGLAVARPGQLATGLQSLGPTHEALALMPTSGHLMGLPAEAGADAVDADGVALLRTAAGVIALMPRVEEFGSAWERGRMVRWSARPLEDDVLPRCVAALPSAAEANRLLLEATAQATQALVDLDVARWRPEAVNALRRANDDEWASRDTPANLDLRRRELLHRAMLVLAITGLAGDDEGAAVTGHERERRTAALRGPAAAARLALSAATHHRR